MCIAGQGPSEVFCQDCSSTGLCVLQALQDQHSSSLTHDKSITVIVPWSGSTLWLVAALGESTACHESSQSNWDDWSLGTTSDNDICIPVTDVVCCCHKGIIGSGTGSGDGVIWTHQPLIDGQQSSTHVSDGIWDKERTHLLISFLHQVGHSVLENLESSHTGTDEHADSRLVKLLVPFWVSFLLNTSVTESLLTGHHGVREAVIISTSILLVNQTLIVKILDLGGEVGWEFGCIKASNVIHTRYTFKQLIVIGVIVISKH
mmetsp:Transcript_919/g.1908  ORF Transcript_919/g.1908 Transcript_919/m.1908 type:complete len:261 (+) Transcript_919:498-1280(+)